MVSRTAAAKYLSEQAIKAIHSTRSADYVCFEEDCEYAIAFFERPEWDRFLKEKDLREWHAIAANTWTYPPGSYMGKAALECIPKVEAHLRMTNDEIREEMRAIVTRWNPEYFGLPNKCGGCDAELPASKGYGFILCDACEAKRSPKDWQGPSGSANFQGIQS